MCRSLATSLVAILFCILLCLPCYAEIVYLSAESNMPATANNLANASASIVAGIMPISFFAAEIEGKFKDAASIWGDAKQFNNIFSKTNVLLNGAVRINVGIASLFAGTGICIDCLFRLASKSGSRAMPNECLRIGTQKFVGLQWNFTTNFGLFVRVAQEGSIKLFTKTKRETVEQIAKDFIKTIETEAMPRNQTNLGLGIRVAI